MGFSSYSLLATVSGKIKAVGPMRIGAGKALSIVTSDLPIVKNSRNDPVVLGSSLKGFFRGHLRRILLMKVDQGRVDKLLEEIFGGTGDNDNASTILFHEVSMKEGRLAERKHVKINPETGGVQNLFEVECVLDGAVFEGKLLSARNLNPKALGLLKTVMDLANLGLARLGGFKSRGYGEISFEISEISVIFPGRSLEDLKAGFEVKNLIPKGFGTIEVKASNGKVSIEGSILKAEIQENATFFGIEMKFKEYEATKFLDSMLKLVKL